MGMDLEDTEHVCGDLHYNWGSWSTFTNYLRDWGVVLTEFKNSNDGDPISAETCRVVASAIEQHIDELSEAHQQWLRPHIAVWRRSEGFRQW